jgi:hypothetical protein
MITKPSSARRSAVFSLSGREGAIEEGVEDGYLAVALIFLQDATVFFFSSFDYCRDLVMDGLDLVR